MLVLTSLSGRSSLTVVVECQNKYVSLDILVWKISLNVVVECQNKRVSHDILVWRKSLNVVMASLSGGCV